MARKIAHGAFFSGWDILQYVSALRDYAETRFNILFGDVRGSVVIRHRPADTQKAEHPGPPRWRPTAGAVDITKSVTAGVTELLRGFRKQGDGAGHQNKYVENHIRLGNLLHPVRAHRVDKTTKDGKSSHDSDSLTVGWSVVVGGRVACGFARAHTGSSEQNLRRSVFR